MIIYPKPEDILIYPGKYLTAEWYCDGEGKMPAFEYYQRRFFNFMTIGAKVIVTNAYRKHSQKMTKQDLEHLRIAVRCKQDYLNRVREGTYYEKES